MNFLKKHKWLILIFLISFLLRILFIDTSYFFWDESVYLMHAEHFSTGSTYYNEFITRPPIVPLILSPFSSVIEVASRIIMPLLNSLLVIIIFLLARKINRKIAFISSSIIAIFPFHILTSRWAMTDTLALLLISTTIYFYWGGLEKNKPYHIYLGGLFFALSILTKFTSLILIPLLIPIFIYFRKGQIKNTMISFVLFIIPFIPFFIFTYRMFGDPFYTFVTAFHVVTDAQAGSFFLLLQTLYDFFNPIILIAFMFGSYFILKQDRKPLLLYLLFWALFIILYYVSLFGRGVAKPPTIEWEVERFILPALTPVVIIASYLFSKLYKVRKQFFYAIFILFVLFSIPGFIRAYTPAIDFEDGIREATKEMALYIQHNTDHNQIIYCNINCPPIAYYSQRTTIISDAPPGGSLFVYLRHTEEKDSNQFINLKSIVREKWKINLYKVE